MVRWPMGSRWSSRAARPRTNRRRDSAVVHQRLGVVGHHVRLVLVAERRVPLVAVDVREHLRPLAGEVELRLQAEALALPLAELPGLLPRCQHLRQLAGTLGYS